MLPVPPNRIAPPADRSGDFKRELTELLNRHSREENSETPDFVLANYILRVLQAYEAAVVAREQWHGRDILRDEPDPLAPVPEEEAEPIPDVEDEPLSSVADLMTQLATGLRADHLVKPRTEAGPAGDDDV